MFPTWRRTEILSKDCLNIVRGKQKICRQRGNIRLRVGDKYGEVFEMVYSTAVDFSNGGKVHQSTLSVYIHLIGEQEKVVEVLCKA